jgi:hypothetical protein
VNLAIGLVVTLAGIDLAIAGVTKRSVSRLLFGYWDAPNTAGSSTSTNAPGTADTGGAYKPAGSTATGTNRVGGTQ